MKSMLIILFLLLPTSVFAKIDYDLEISLQPAEQQLIATARIDFNTAAQDQLKLQLAPQAEIIEIRQGKNLILHSFVAGVLQFEPNGLEPVSISYRITFKDLAESRPPHNEDPSYGISASISTEGSYLSSAAGWYPRLTMQDIQYRIHISAPTGTEAITSGRRISRQTNGGLSSSVWLVDYPLSGLTLSAGPYQVFEDLSGPVPIYAYFYALSAPLADSYLKEARNNMQLYTELFGPYPFHKFAIVENFFPTGYGLPSWTLLGSSVIKLPFIVKTSLGHEIAHSWWGIGVQVDYTQGNWSEGLTTYVADYLYKERSSAAEAQEYRQNILRDYANLVSTQNTFAIKDFSARFDKTSQVIGYGKTAFLFHMLRKRIGDDLFWRGLRQLALTGMHSRIGWEDFSKMFSGLSGQNLQPFFAQWLRRKDGPQLELHDVNRVEIGPGENGGPRWRVSGRLTQQPGYQLAVELQLNCANETLRERLELDTISKAFSFETASLPLLLEADPTADLFRILAAEELPATVNSIRGSNQLLILKADESAPDTEAIKTLIGALRKSELPVRNLSEVSQAELASHDLLIFGQPHQLRPIILQSAVKGQFTLQNQSIDLNKQSAFIVEPNPLNRDKKAAWFVSQNNQAAVVARKIPHYGKYSILMFDGSENRLKKIITPIESTLKISFK